jgi:hypothetical protein
MGYCDCFMAIEFYNGGGLPAVWSVVKTIFKVPAKMILYALFPCCPQILKIFGSRKLGTSKAVPIFL